MPLYYTSPCVADNRQITYRTGNSMSNDTHRTTANTRLVIILIALLAFGLRLLPGPRIIDDAYITYRYAANLAAGHGLVYNVGDAVLGTTTPLYALLMAALAGLAGAGALPALSPIVNAMADAVNVVLLWLIARRLFDSDLPGFAISTLWALAPRSVTFAVGGLETSVTVMVMLGAFACWLSGRSRAAAALAGLAFLARPDTLIWSGPLALAMIAEAWIERPDLPLLRRLPWKELGVFLLVTTPWVAYAWLTYGSPLPHSIAAKAVAYRLAPTQAVVSLIQNLAEPFFEFDAFGPSGALAGLITYTSLSVVGVIDLLRRQWRAFPVVLYPWLFFATYALANPLMFRWYSTPIMPVYFLVLVGGLWALGRSSGRSAVRLWLVGVTSVFWAALSLNAWTLHPDHGSPRPAPRMAWIELELVYERAGRFLAPHVNADTVVGVADIGAVGWYSGARILDTLGLVSAEATAYYPVDPELISGMAYAVPPDLIFDELPDYLVLLEVYVRRGLLTDPRFTEQYVLLRKVETTIYDSDGLLIFARRDVP